jgi:hypothetical protein
MVSQRWNASFSWPDLSSLELLHAGGENKFETDFDNWSADRVQLVVQTKVNAATSQ